MEQTFTPPELSSELADVCGEAVLWLARALHWVDLQLVGEREIGMKRILMDGMGFRENSKSVYEGTSGALA